MTVVALTRNVAIVDKRQARRVGWVCRVTSDTASRIWIACLPARQEEMIVSVRPTILFTFLSPLHNIAVTLETRIIAQRVGGDGGFVIFARKKRHQIVRTLRQSLRSAEHSAAAVTIDASGILLCVKRGKRRWICFG